MLKILWEQKNTQGPESFHDAFDFQRAKSVGGKTSSPMPLPPGWDDDGLRNLEDKPFIPLVVFGGVEVSMIRDGRYCIFSVEKQEFWRLFYSQAAFCS